MTDKKGPEISRLDAAKRHAAALAAKRAPGLLGSQAAGKSESRDTIPNGTKNAITIIPQQRPDTLEAVKALVLDSLNSRHSKLAYGFALDAFLPWLRSVWRGPFNRAAVHAYKAHLLADKLAPATICARLAAVKKLASEAEENGLLDPMIAAGISRIRGVPRLGVRVGNWLSREQAQQLLDAPDPSTFVGIRDRAMLAVLLGAGLRREEAANLTFEHIQTRDGRAVICDIKGKRGRIRTVPIGAWVRQAIDEWAQAAGISTGIVFRAAYTRGFDHSAARSMRDAGMTFTKIAAHFGVSASAVSYAAKKGETGARLLRDRPLTAQCIFKIVKRHAASIGVDVAPHDLRRSFAKLARKGGSPIEQISLSLGHSEISTTQRYLGIELDLTDAPADRLGLGAPRRRKR